MDRWLEQHVRVHAQERPTDPAASSLAGTTDWATLDQEIDRVASHLLDLGLRPGDRVAFLGRNRREVAAIMLGVRRARLAYVPLNFRLAADEQRAVLGLSRPAAIIVEPTLAGNLPATDAPTILLGEEAAADRWGQLESTTAREVGPDEVGAADPDDPAIIYFTSGTSGAPKGVLHRLGPCELAASYRDAWRMDADTTALIVPPAFHIAGSLWVQFAVHAGGHQVLLSEATPMSILQTIERFEVTHAVFVPTLLKVLLDQLDAAGEDAPSMSTLRLIGYGASPIPPTLLDRSLRRFGCELSQAYGMTEMNGVVSQLQPEDHHPEPGYEHRLRSAGTLAPDTEARVVDPTSGEVLPNGVDGELEYRGPLFMAGYLDNPEATAAVTTDDGFFRSGDVGHLDDDGYVYITDRVSDLIITGGENVYPVEVEHVLSGHDGVSDVAVFGVPDDTWGERIVAAIVRTPGAGSDVGGELTAFCRQRIAGYKVPKQFVELDEIPRNAAGKVVRADLRRRFG